MINLLKKLNAIIINSHIVYTSGKHGSTYVNKDAIYPHTKIISELCLQIAKHFKDSGVEIVIAPAIGGVILSQWIAYHLSGLLNKEILGVYAEKAKNSDEFIIKRGYDKLVKNKKILVVEDILTTGGSVKKVIKEVENLNGQVIGVAALCNRGNIQASDLGNISELYALINLNFETWEPDQCPLCKQNIPINTQVGKGAKSL